MDKLTKAFSADITIKEGERSFIAKISTGAVDRDGEVLMPQGCNFKDYFANPVVMHNHDYSALPVGKCVALDRDEKGIIAKGIFAERPKDYPEGSEWLPDTLLSLYQQKVLRAFSVGIDRVGYESRLPTKKDIDTYGDGVRRVTSKWKMIEFSTCAIGVNQEALASAVAKGLSKETCKAIFGNELALEITPGGLEVYKTEVVEDVPPIPKHVVIVVSATDAPPKKQVNIQKVIKDTLAVKRGVVYLH